MCANQMRMSFSIFAGKLIEVLREVGPEGTAVASIETIRTRLLKLAAYVKVTVRRVWLEFPEVFPRQDVFRAAVRRGGRQRRSAGGLPGET